MRLTRTPADAHQWPMPDDETRGDPGVSRGTEDAMFGVVATWAGAVAGLLVLVLMALSGVLIDSQR
ncbi:hypothetical protein GCM10009634_08760 [Saccharothrix xinjiangensis]